MTPTRSVVLSTRTSPTEATLIALLAESAGATVSTVLRELALATARKRLAKTGGEGVGVARDAGRTNAPA